MWLSPRLKDVLPVLYLRGLPTGDFSEALEALLGPKAADLSATTINRFLKGWQDEYRAWRKRSPKGKEYVCIWADGVYFDVRLQRDRLAGLVIIGVRPDCRKEVVALEDGHRESKESWASALRGLKRRGGRMDTFGGYIWAFVTDGPEAVRYFGRDQSRGHLVAKGILEDDFHGHLVTDFYAANNLFFASTNAAGPTCCETFTNSRKPMPGLPK